MKRIIFVILIAVQFDFGYAQIDTLTDLRDGKKYETIVIGNKRWMREHLRFETQHSYCPFFNRGTDDCKKGNYYLNMELDSICPKGWHVATIDEWEQYVQAMLRVNNIPANNVKYETFSPPKNLIMVTIKGLNLYEDSLLKLTPIGWVEGNKTANKGTLSIWVIDNRTHDKKYHIHLGKSNYIVHAHDHHIIDKPNKIRKFAVRCVCELK